MSTPPERSEGAGDPYGHTQAGGLLMAAPLRVEAVLISSAAKGVLIRKTGMGPDKAKAAAGDLTAAAGRALLVVGFCGGLDESSVPGEVIVARDVYAAVDEGHPEERIDCSLAEPLLGRLTGLGMKVRVGSVVCVSKLALGERRAELHAAGAIAVDMESVWLARGSGGRPFGVVRVVLDAPEHELMRPQAVGGALRAALALRRVAGALHDWAPGD
jgi:4-hydroxy-3-methylbut-2-enyl diphosphate reductase